MMTARPFEYEKDLEKVNRWGEKHAFPLPPQGLLPKNGFIVNECVCGFLYLSDSAIGWIEWVFSDPEKSKEERAESLDMLFRLLEKIALEKGVLALFSSSGSHAFSVVLDRHGFQEADRGVSQYIKYIGDF